MENKASQPVVWSWIESVANVVVGLMINIWLQTLVFPFFGINIPWTANLGIAAIFTVASIIRSFTMRRIFNIIHVIGYVNIAKRFVRVYNSVGKFFKSILGRIN